MSGRSVHGLEYHYSDGAFGDCLHVNVTICYYGKTDRFAIYKLVKISNFTVFQYRYNNSILLFENEIQK